MKEKIILVGGGGHCHSVIDVIEQTNKYEIIDIVFRNKLTAESIVLDVTNKYITEEFIKSVNPDIIVNCIGILIKGSQ